MKNRNFMKKAYRSFADFVKAASTRELEYFVLDGEYSTDFNNRVRKLIDDIGQEGKVVADFFALFNSKGEIAVIDEEIVGAYISDRYNVVVESYYKKPNLNAIVSSVVNGSEKAKRDFVLISYGCIYKTLKEIYKEITYRKDIENIYMKLLDLKDYKGEDSAIIILATLITEDICRYLGIKINYNWVVSA